MREISIEILLAFCKQIISAKVGGDASYLLVSEISQKLIIIPVFDPRKI